MTRTQEIRLVIGTPVPKHVKQHLGGPTVAFQLHDSEQVSLSLEALDSEGNPAAVNVGWASSDDTIVAIQLNGDGTVTAVASPGEGGLGSATVTATVTDVSDGDDHSATFDIEVVAGDAVTVNIVPGTPEAKPPTP